MFHNLVKLEMELGTYYEIIFYNVLPTEVKNRSYNSFKTSINLFLLDDTLYSINKYLNADFIIVFSVVHLFHLVLPSCSSSILTCENTIHNKLATINIIIIIIAMSTIFGADITSLG